MDRGGAARRWGQPLKTKQSTLKRARELRRNLTEAETILWSKLQDDKLMGYRFVKQHPIGPYFADFACRRRKLVIEVDGATHSTPEERAHDARRTAFMEREGWTVVRFWNHEIKANLNGVVESILQRLPHRLADCVSDPPPPAFGRGRKRPGLLARLSMRLACAWEFGGPT